MSDIDNTLAQRGARYGEFTEHAEVTQEIKRAMGVGQNWEYLPDDMRECLEMVAHKIGRILNGDPNYIDSWTDIIGYTRLVEKRLLDGQESQRSFAFAPQGSAKPAESTKGDCACLACQIAEQLDKQNAQWSAAEIEKFKSQSPKEPMKFNEITVLVDFLVGDFRRANS